MNNLAFVLRSQGNYEEVEQIHRQALALRERVLGKEYPDTLGSMNNLASVLSSQGKYEEAEQIHQQSIGIDGKGTGQGESINADKYEQSGISVKQSRQL